MPVNPLGHGRLGGLRTPRECRINGERIKVIWDDAALGEFGCGTIAVAKEEVLRKYPDAVLGFSWWPRRLLPARWERRLGPGHQAVQPFGWRPALIADEGVARVVAVIIGPDLDEQSYWPP